VIDRVPKRLWLLVAIPILALSVRVHLRGQPDGGLDHDEVIAMMAICGTQVDYARPAAGERRAMTSLHGFTRLQPDRGFGSLLAGLHSRDIHPPGFFVLGRIWLLAGVGVLGVDGGSARALDRWMTALPGVLVVLAVLLLLADGATREGVRRAAPWLAALVLCDLEFVVGQSANVRPYALVILLATAALLCTVRMLEREVISVRDGVALGALVGLGMLTHYLFAPLALGLGAGAAWSRRPGWRRALGISIAISAALLAPWLAFAGLPSPPDHFLGGWGSFVALVNGTEGLVRKYVERATGAGSPLPGPVLIWWVALTAWLVTRRGRDNDGVRAVGFGLAAVLLVPMAYDLLRPAHLLTKDRTAVTWIPAAGLGISILLTRALRRAALPAVALASLLAHVVVPGSTEPSSHGETWVDMGRRVGERTDPSRPEPTSILVGGNCGARGKLLRMSRYLPDHGAFVRLDERRVSRLVDEVAGEDVVVLLWQRRPGYGGDRPRVPESEMTAVRQLMKAEGYRLVGRRGRKISGWMLWTRIPR
jgi:hypothetical protein